VSIRLKLCLAFLLTTLSAVAGMLVFVQWSLDRGFLEYINTQALEKLADFDQPLAEYYQKNGSWDSLRNDPRSWHRLLMVSSPEYQGLSSNREPQQEHQREWQQELQREQKELQQEQQEPQLENKEPQRELQKLQQDPPSERFGDFSRQGLKPRRFSDGQGQPPPPPNRRGEFGSRQNRFDFGGRREPGPRPVPPEVHSRIKGIVLLDADKNIVVGLMKHDRDANLQMFPIKLDDVVVGYLGVKQPKELTEQLDLRFVEQQMKAFGLIAFVIALFVLMVAIPLALHLVRPIKTLTKGTHALTAGDFNTRINVTTKDELGQLSEDFNHLAKTLDANEQARRRWIADISHELRTPLSILKGHIEAVQDGVRRPTVETVSLLEGKVNDLTRLVDDLYELSLSDMGALTYRKQSLVLAHQLEDCIDSYEDAFTQSQLTIESAIDIGDKHKIFADPERLSQLFSNLFKNTQRYTDAGGTLTVAAKANADMVTIELNDTSPGVSDQDLEHIFDRLYRAEGSRNRATGGAGLGMSICKNIVEAHDGNISATKSPMGGLNVEIKLPLSSS